MVEVKILGPEGDKSEKLYDKAQKAIAHAGVKATLTQVQDQEDISVYRVGLMPALVINGAVKSTGKVPKITQIVDWLKAASSV